MLYALRFMLQDEGFSFIGVITGISIAMTALVGILSLASMSLKSAEIAQSRMIASGLAQEGLEVIRGVRRSYLEWTQWDWYATSSPTLIPIGTSVDYCVQYDTFSLVGQACDDPDEEPLKFDALSGLYQYVSGDDTPFYRKVIMTRLDVDEIKVVAQIKWKARANDEWYTLVAEDRLWNWK